ncbi:hypothetical protein D3C71_2117390 [compost metagenome]
MALARNMPCNSSSQPPFLLIILSCPACTSASATIMLMATINAAGRVHSPMISRMGATTSPI